MVNQISFSLNHLQQIGIPKERIEEFCILIIGQKNKVLVPWKKFF
jgi:hypothetical protein